jgi:hypothetical protein
MDNTDLVTATTVMRQAMMENPTLRYGVVSKVAHLMVKEGAEPDLNKALNLASDILDLVLE